MKGETCSPIVLCGKTNAYRIEAPSRRRGEAESPAREEVYNREMHQKFLDSVIRSTTALVRLYELQKHPPPILPVTSSSCQQFSDERSDKQKAAPKSLYLVVDIHQSITRERGA